MNYERNELLDRLAARFALGTMAGGARRRFRRLLRESRSARERTREWDATLGVLAASLPPIEPSPSLWQRIAARTSGSAPPQAAARRSSWWRWLTGGAGFAFGALVSALVLRIAPSPLIDVERVAQQTEALPQSYAGILSNAAGKPALLVNSARHGRRAFVKVLAPFELPAGSVARLYALAAGATPFALGDVPSAGKAELRLADTSEKLLSKVSELAVAIVPAGAPASFVPDAWLLRGPCAKFW